MITSTPPLIVTAWLEDSAFAWFDDLRRAHFPPARNVVPAHMTLFHALPGEAEPQLAGVLKAICDRTPNVEVEVRGPWSIGRGVAYRMHAPELESVRAEIAVAFAGLLTPQDRAPWRPHITVQNKVDPAEAKALLEQLQHDFVPFAFAVRGLEVWRYMGGPWAPVAQVPFSG